MKNSFVERSVSQRGGRVIGEINNRGKSSATDRIVFPGKRLFSNQFSRFFLLLNQPVYQGTRRWLNMATAFSPFVSRVRSNRDRGEFLLQTRRKLFGSPLCLSLFLSSKSLISWKLRGLHVLLLETDNQWAEIF